MRIELSVQECRWLTDLVNKAKNKAIRYNEESPHAIFEIRRDNMADLESKLNGAVERQIHKERSERNER